MMFHRLLVFNHQNDGIEDGVISPFEVSTGDWDSSRRIVLYRPISFEFRVLFVGGIKRRNEGSQNQD